MGDQCEVEAEAAGCRAEGRAGVHRRRHVGHRPPDPVRGGAPPGGIRRRPPGSGTPHPGFWYRLSTRHDRRHMACVVTTRLIWSTYHTVTIYRRRTHLDTGIILCLVVVVIVSVVLVVLVVLVVVRSSSRSSWWSWPSSWSSSRHANLYHRSTVTLNCTTVRHYRPASKEALHICWQRRRLACAGHRMKAFYPRTVPWKLVAAAWKTLGKGIHIHCALQRIFELAYTAIQYSLAPNPADTPLRGWPPRRSSSTC